MKYLLFFAVAILSHVYEIRAQKCHLRELDLCAASLLVSTQGQSGVATTDKDVDRQCGFIKEADTCVRNFVKNCMTKDQQSLTKSVFDNVGRFQKEYCTPGTSLRQNYLKYAPCINTVNKESKPCMKDLQAALEVVTSARRDKRIGLGCCAYRRLRGCLTKLTKDKCGDDTVKFFNNLFNAVIGRLPDVVCHEFTPSNALCKELPPPGSQPKGGRSTSILNRLLSAYTNF